MPGASADMKCTGDVSCFSPGQWAFITHPDSGGGEFFQISQVQTATNGLAHSTDPLSTIYDKDAMVVSLERITFFVDNTTDPDHPNLMIYYPGLTGAAVFAENISDLQLQYKLKNGVIVDQPVVADDIREVLISVTGRSKNPDYEKTDDPYRHRTYASSVNVRNLGS